MSKDPSTLSFQSDRTRTCILAAYWAVVVLSLPLWWYTTSIERLSLPTTRVFAQATRQLRFPIQVTLEADAATTNDLQQIIDRRAVNAPTIWSGIDVTVITKAAAEEADERAGAYTVTFRHGPASVHNRTLSWPLDRAHSLHSLADLLSDLLVPYSASSSLEHRVVPYAPRYRLAFTLLNEDASEGHAATDWEVRSVISNHITPIVKSLAILHNFTIESQIQFHAPLAISPRHYRSSEGDVYMLTPEDLTVFVNSAEWSLSSSVSNDPVLHFLMFIPSSSRRPLRILDNDNSISPSNAFLLPQWGSIVIYNPPTDSPLEFELTSADLDRTFSSFASQLLALLGVPSLPQDIQTSASGNDDGPRAPLLTSGWQFDALVRWRALENTRGSQETLRSIVQLVDRIENMPIGEGVKGDVLDALAALEKTYSAAPTSTLLALRRSIDAAALASRAFFNPGMLALLYFPPEHKYAVYAPLFASAMIPLVAAALREIAAWRRRVRELRGARGTGPGVGKGKVE